MKNRLRMNGGAVLLARIKAIFITIRHPGKESCFFWVCGTSRRINSTRSKPCAREARRRWIFILPEILIIASFSAFGQLSVIGGGGPLFPGKVDSANLVVKFKKANKRIDSLVMRLDTAFFGEFKNNIDSTIHYVDAVLKKRQEIGGSKAGPKFDAVLHFIRDKKRVAQVSFCSKRMRSALLDVKSEKYPYVVTFKPDFARKLDSLAKELRKRIPRKK